MKKLFFFRPSTDKQVCVENSPNSGPGSQQKTRDEQSYRSLRTSLFKAQNQVPENENLDPGIVLRRSRSFSSAAFLGDATAHRTLSCMSDQSSSPSSSSSSVTAQKHIRSSRGRTLTPERHVKAKRSTRLPLENVPGKPLSSRSSRYYRDHSGNVSLSSSNLSNDVLDLYIDGEQHYERGSPMTKTSSKDHGKHVGGKRPPRIHCTAPGSPIGSIKDNPRPHSFRAARGLDPHPSSRDWIETGVGCESPKELAKHVVEKLCQTRSSSKADPRDYESDIPITIEDVYSGPMNRNAMSGTAFRKGFAPGAVLTSTNGPQHEDYLYSEDKFDDRFAADIGDELDMESMRKQLRVLSLELESRTQKLQKENNEIQSAMEKELDRRSNDWSLKVERFQAEELRLRERVRELAEQNVSLQRELSSLSEVETDRLNMEKQVKDLTTLLEATRGENQDLRQGICELQGKYKVSNEDRVCIQRSYSEKEEECKDLHACVTRSVRTCSEQEKTIDGLRGELVELVQKKHPMEHSARHVQKLQLEQIRLTGVEQTLRRDIESYKSEVDSLRHENIGLLNRLRAGGDGGGLLTLRLDEELRDRLDLVQKQGLSLLNESTSLCSKLLDSLKRVSRSVGKESTEDSRSSLNAQFIMESDMKVQGYRRGTESLTRSLQNISTVLHEKSDLSLSNSQMKNTDDSAIGLQNGSDLQDCTRSELRAEMLLTSLLREKLYALSQEVEQLQAEVATAARGNDVLRCEVQNSCDSLSAVTHRMKEVELQMIKKEEKMHQLQSDLQDSTKELTVMRGILPKVTEERDMMWEEVKHNTEKNMLLNSEVNILRKKIDSLEEEILVREGQMTILRDTLGSKSFDLLSSPDRTHEYLLN